MTRENVQHSELKPLPSVDVVLDSLSSGDLNDLCDSTDEAILAGGGFGWVHLPNRNILERYWQGVLAMPSRRLFVARLDNVICGAGQLAFPPSNNEAQTYTAQLSGLFIAPWARGQGLSRRLLDLIEKTALRSGYAIINLDVRSSQETAIRLYESAGYTLVGTNPHYAVIDDEFVAGRYYTKMIQPLASAQDARKNSSNSQEKDL